MRLMIRSGFDRFSGYGNDAIDIAVFAAKAGIDVVPWPMNVMPGLPPEFVPLLTKDPRGRYDVSLTFGPPFDIRPWEFAHLADKAVGWTMWERTPMVKDDMRDHGWDLRRGKRWWSGGGGLEKLEGSIGGRRWNLDMMLVTCHMNVDAVHGLDPHVPMAVLPCGIDPDRWPTVRRDPSRQLTFGMIGMLGGRKDPFVLLNAWRELKDEGFDARLKIHTLAAGLHPKIAEWLPDVEFSQHALNERELVGWYHDCDVLVSTSRGEGNNKPAMEMMATGGTVIATDWSGHQNWLHEDVAYPLSGRLMARTAPEGTFDFRADVEHLKELMRRCEARRAEVAWKGWNAAGWIKAAFSWDEVVAKLEKILINL